MFVVYLISYDWGSPQKDYSRLIGRLHELGARPILSATWVLCSTLTAAQVLRSLMPYHDSQERVLIAELRNTNCASYNTIATVESAA
jgi:hypothetical protein